VDIDIDPMLFYAAVIEEQLDVLDMVADMGAIFVHMEGVADIAHEHLASAQEALDRLIEEDTSWRPA